MALNADLIFVLAGRAVRKRFALELFRGGVAPRVLFSVARFEVRGFRELPLPVGFDLLPVAQLVAAPERHFFVLFGDGATPQVERIKVRRFGTLREIEALAGFLDRRREIRSVIVVTSAVHIRRVALCCRVLLPRDVRFEMVAVPRVDGGDHGPGDEMEGGVRGVTRGADASPACGTAATKTVEPRASAVEFIIESLKFGVYRVMLFFRGRPRSQD
jgi:hypothetical protein